MSLVDTALAERLEKYLDLVAFREALITSNIANVDTPGYKTRDIDFETELRRAELDLAQQDLHPVVRQTPGLLERPDGNNVSMDRESMALAQTQLHFQIGIQLLRHEFQRVLAAIKEGTQQP